MFFRKDKDIDIDQLKETLKIDEGVVYEIYNDHLGYPTFGIGHLVLESDPEHGAAVGTPVSEDRVDECFEKDVESVISDCKKLHEGWEDYPQEVKQIVANMMFNMGLTRLSKFKKHNAALVAGDWNTAVPARPPGAGPSVCAALGKPHLHVPKLAAVTSTR